MHEGMEQRLFSCIARDRLPQALLLTGQPDAGQEALARRAAARYCLGEDRVEGLTNCPNYRELDGWAVGVRQVRELMAAAGVQSFNGGRRVFLIRNAHGMSEQSQNALLKTLEEPPADTVLMLTGSEMGLLPTIRSRCTILRMGAQPVEAVQAMLTACGVEADAARIAARASDGIPGLAEVLADPETAAFRTRAIELLRDALAGEAPFLETGGLITGMVEDPKTGERKKKADPRRAELLFTIWAGVMGDALNTREGGGPIRNVDCENLIAGMAASFTSEKIQGIIDILTSACRNLSCLASPTMTVDTVLAGLICPGGQAKEKV